MKYRAINNVYVDGQVIAAGTIFETKDDKAIAALIERGSVANEDAEFTPNLSAFEQAQAETAELNKVHTDQVAIDAASQAKVNEELAAQREQTAAQGEPASPDPLPASPVDSAPVENPSEPAPAQPQQIPVTQREELTPEEQKIRQEAASLESGPTSPGLQLN